MSFKKIEITPDTKVGDVLGEKKCEACDTTMVKSAVLDEYQTKKAGKDVLKVSSWIDETGQAHLRPEGVGNFICKKTGQNVSKRKTQKTITDDPNNTSKVHVDSHSHADLNKGIHELKEMISEVIKELKTITEREK